MKKIKKGFQNLNISEKNLIPRSELRKIVGGESACIDECLATTSGPDTLLCIEQCEAAATVCDMGAPCSYYEAGTGVVSGNCDIQLTGNYRCICKSANSAVILTTCDNY